MLAFGEASSLSLAIYVSSGSTAERYPLLTPERLFSGNLGKNRGEIALKCGGKFVPLRG